MSLHCYIVVSASRTTGCFSTLFTAYFKVPNVIKKVGSPTVTSEPKKTCYCTALVNILFLPSYTLSVVERGSAKKPLGAKASVAL
jgi:hypothetical protein